MWHDGQRQPHYARSPPTRSPHSPPRRVRGCPPASAKLAPCDAQMLSACPVDSLRAAHHIHARRSVDSAALSSASSISYARARSSPGPAHKARHVLVADTRGFCAHIPTLLQLPPNSRCCATSTTASISRLPRFAFLPVTRPFLPEPRADCNYRKLVAQTIVFDALDALQYTARHQKARVVGRLGLRLAFASRTLRTPSSRRPRPLTDPVASNCIRLPGCATVHSAGPTAARRRLPLSASRCARSPGPDLAQTASLDRSVRDLVKPVLSA